MCMRLNKKRGRLLSLSLKTMAAAALTFFPRRGYTFQVITSSNVRLTSAARHASRSGAQSQQLQKRIRKGHEVCMVIQTSSRITIGGPLMMGTAVRRVSRVAMAARGDLRNGRDMDRGLSTSGLDDFSDRQMSGDSHPFWTSRGRGEGGSNVRRSGDASNVDSNRGRGSGKREWDSNRVERGRGSHDRGSFQGERTSTWDGRGRENGGRRQGGRGRSFGGRRDPNEGGVRENGSQDQVTSTWDGRGKGNGGRRQGGRGQSFGGRRDPSEEWARENGSQDQVQTDGRRGQRQGGHVSEEWDKADGDRGGGSAPASEWMKGALSDFQGELSPNRGLDEDTDFDMVYGIAPVLNALRNRRREKLGLYCQDGLAPANKKDRAAADTIYDLARESDVMTTTTDKGYLNSLCGNRPHQGFVLKARPLEFVPILFLPPIEAADSKAIAISTDTITTEEKAGNAAGRGESGVDRVTVTTKGREPSAPEVPTAPALDTTQARAQVWVALDEVTDPQNFGALLRSAHFFGATGVVACAKNSASLTPVVSKASAGAAEVMRVHSTANMMRFLKRCKENGWRIVGTAVSESSVPLTELPAGPDAPPTVVVLGNEGYGVRASVLRECDVLVEVVGSGGGAADQGTATSTVDSLNVSVTGGIMLFHLLAAAGK